MAKEKMSIEKKTKLIYCGELIFFAVVFLVLATLEVLKIIGKNKVMLDIFNWVTIFGGAWMIIDFFWVMFSKKRRKKNSLLDKGLLIPLGIYFITFDILCFCKVPVVMENRNLMMGIAFYYVGVIYLFQGLYHYSHPVPLLLQAIEEAKQAEQQKLAEEQQAEEKPQEEKPESEVKEDK